MDGLALLHGDAVPLVDRDNESPTALERQAQDTRILFGNALVRIEHHDNDMGFVDGLQGFGHAGALDDVVYFRATAHARRIDEDEIAIVAAKGYEDAVTRGAGHIARYHALLPQEPVDQR